MHVRKPASMSVSSIFHASIWGDSSQTFTYRHPGDCTDDGLYTVSVCVWDRQRFYSQYHPSWSQTNCHSDCGQLALTGLRHTYTCIMYTLRLTRQITDSSWSHTGKNHGELGTFGVNLKSAPGSLRVAGYMETRACRSIFGRARARVCACNKGGGKK